MAKLPWRGHMRGRAQMILTNYTHNPESGENQSIWLLRHTSSQSRTTLEQKLTVTRDSFGRFTPVIALDDFPERLSERESMLKLADWLHRLGVAIEDNWSEPQ